MGVVAGVLAVVIVFVLAFLISMIPAWLLLLAYNYVVEMMGHTDITVPVTFWTVVCVAFIMAVLRGIFSSSSSK
ncbi:hypothetical protein NWUPM3A1_198 [Escherichia phage vB_EcoM_3A1_SA_NWU]|uniref:hypothetical protein n=1 Tax=Escherichia coli TaxID=562 RepID=UPI001E57D28C|nr:hypothetical protein [Escherichia coli]MCC5410270.1 hypothetical protein [Escherichia coli]MCC5411291.1 hypothetical protein [Escherichia coli]WIL78258.1 hypothetical protein NWUPM3A1_198 [Escherichia phage vB_EcoM_3A1_SA_NWU]